MNGHIYDIKEGVFDKHSESKDRLGLVAQEVNEVLPQLVSHNDEVDSYYLEYDGIIPVLVEGIKEFKKIHDEKNKELDRVLEELKQQSDTLQQENSELRSQLELLVRAN